MTIQEGTVARSDFHDGRDILSGSCCRVSAIRAFRDSQRQLQDARATTDAGLAEQLADLSRALLLHALSASAAALVRHRRRAGPEI